MGSITGQGIDQTARAAATAAQSTATSAAGAASTAQTTANDASKNRRFPLTSITGTDNIVSAALPSGFVALSDMMGFVFESLGANTGAMTLDIGDGVPRTLVHIGGATMIAGDIPSADCVVECFYDVSNNWFHAQLIRQPSSTTPAADSSAGTVGTSTRYSRSDHSHPANVDATAAAKPSGAAAAGSSTVYARRDHQHGSAIVGTTTNDSAAAGDVGEYVSSSVAIGSAISLSTGVAANVTSISLSAGDWDVSGAVHFVPTATTSISFEAAGVNSTSATFGAVGTYAQRVQAASVSGSTTGDAYTIPRTRFSLTGTTTIYLVAQGNFSASTLKAAGQISARRVR